MDISLDTAPRTDDESNKTCSCVTSSPKEESGAAFVDAFEFLSAARKCQMLRSQQDTMLRFFAHCHRLAISSYFVFLGQILTPFLIYPNVHHFCAEHQNYEQPYFCRSRVCSSRQTNIKSNFERGAVIYVIPVEASLRRFIESPSGSDFFYRQRRPRTTLIFFLAHQILPF